MRKIDLLPWPELLASLTASGYAVTSTLLSEEECTQIVKLYPREELFRSQVIMERHRFGLGDYKYFAYPLPGIVEGLRTHAYPRLASLANIWAQELGDTVPYPRSHQEFLKICHRAGQTRPTPLLLHYEKNGYNCLHQDMYGAVYFPMQMVVMLGQQDRDWQGGQLVLVEQRPRAQSKAEVVHADQGCAIIFTTRYRPVSGRRGYYRVNLRHGVSTVRSGTRYTLGIIFHDAE